jgi:hypothetical protein
MQVYPREAEQFCWIIVVIVTPDWVNMMNKYDLYDKLPKKAVQADFRLPVAVSIAVGIKNAGRTDDKLPARGGWRSDHAYAGTSSRTGGICGNPEF